jgi:Na+-transporting NADH:ubiquinone oxidoreductase subunit NqrB
MTTLSARIDPAVAPAPGAALLPRLRTFAARFARDPRHYQMTVQALLLLWGLALLDFEITAARAALTLVSVLAAQWACTRVFTPAARFEWRSALISGLSLCLLLRVTSAFWIVAGGGLTIASKFAFRWRGKHLFNPTCFGLVAMIALTREAWVSPGQWGHAAILGFAILCLGSIVVTRAARADVTFAFLLAWAAVLFGRAAWLGQPPMTPQHMLANGSILLFAFFMISDPRTTPDSRAGRIVFATLVALGAGFVQFVLYRTNGPLWSLVACSLLVPLLDHWLPGRRHAWAREGSTSRTGDPHAASLPARA